MSDEIKTNQDLIDGVYGDMIKGNNPDTEPQGGDGDGLVNDDPANAVNQPDAEPDIEPVSDDPNRLEDTDGNDQVVDKDTEPDVSATDDKDTDNFDLFDDWDSASTETVSDNDQAASTENYSDIANELGLEDSNKEAIIEAYNKLKEDAQLVDEYKKLPGELVQAIELAKQGKDYKTLFSNESTVDHAKFDDRTLLLNQNSKYFTDPEGNVDNEALQEYVDDMTEIQQKIEASKVRENIDEYNRVEKERAIQTKYEKQQMAQRELQSVISDISEVKGFKVKPEHKEEAFQKISNGDAVKEMFMKPDGTYDMNKLFTNYFLYKNFDKIKSYLSRRAKDETRVNDFNQISNADPNTRSHHPDPVPEGTKDLAETYLDELKSRAGIK